MSLHSASFYHLKSHFISLERHVGGGFLPPCCIEKCELTRQGGLFPPCCVDSLGTLRPNPHGFWYPHNLQVPIPIPIKLIPCTCQVTHGLPVTGPTLSCPTLPYPTLLYSTLPYPTLGTFDPRFYPRYQSFLPITLQHPS